MLDKGLHQLEGFADLTEKLGLAVLDFGSVRGEEIGMVLLGLFAKSGLDPPRLQVAEKIEGQMDLGTEQGSAGRKNLIFVKTGQHAGRSPFAERLKHLANLYTKGRKSTSGLPGNVLVPLTDPGGCPYSA